MLGSWYTETEVQKGMRTSPWSRNSEPDEWKTDKASKSQHGSVLCSRRAHCLSDKRQLWAGRAMTSCLEYLSTLLPTLHHGYLIILFFSAQFYLCILKSLRMLQCLYVFNFALQLFVFLLKFNCLLNRLYEVNQFDTDINFLYVVHTM